MPTWPLSWKGLLHSAKFSKARTCEVLWQAAKVTSPSPQHDGILHETGSGGMWTWLMQTPWQSLQARSCLILLQGLEEVNFGFGHNCDKRLMWNEKAEGTAGRAYHLFWKGLLKICDFLKGSSPWGVLKQECIQWQDCISMVRWALWRDLLNGRGEVRRWLCFRVF